MGWYFIPANAMSERSQIAFKEFLKLTKHGAKFIDIHVRKDAKQYEFRAPIGLLRTNKGMLSIVFPEQPKQRGE